MSKLDEEDLNWTAEQLVLDHLSQGPEYITFDETLADEFPDEYDEEDVERLAVKVRLLLTKALELLRDNAL